MTTVQSWVLSYLLNSLWQVPLLFAVGWLAARALRPLGAAAEHRLWVSVLFLQTLLPACSALPPELFRALYSRFGAFLAFFTNTHPAADSEVSIIMGPGAGLSTLHIPPALLAAIVIAYAATTIYFAARFLWRCRHLHTLRRESAPIALTGEAALYWKQCLEHFAIKHFVLKHFVFDKFAIGEVSIAATSHIRGPVTIGLTRKLLLLPATMVADLPEADLRTVIAHEFAHMRRNDFLKNLIYELLALPASYHPALWFTRERIMETREVVCDEIAAPIANPPLATSRDPRNEYARSLLRLASLLVTGKPIRTPHAIGIFDANAFERRLMKLAQQPTQIRGPRRFALIAACAVLGLATCASALALRLSVNTLPTSTDKNSKAPDSLSVPASEMAGNVLTKVAPKYPEEAKKERIQGTVLLNAVIGKDGAVEELTVASGPKELQQSALDAVRQWTYKPYLLNGDPTEVKTTISVVYTLAR